MEVILAILVAIMLFISMYVGCLYFYEHNHPKEEEKTSFSSSGKTENSKKYKEEKRIWIDDWLKINFELQLINLQILQDQQRKQKQKEEKQKNSFKKSCMEKFYSFAKDADYEEIADVKLLENSKI